MNADADLPDGTDIYWSNVSPANPAYVGDVGYITIVSATNLSGTSPASVADLNKSAPKLQDLNPQAQCATPHFSAR